MAKFLGQGVQCSGNLRKYLKSVRAALEIKSTTENVLFDANLIFHLPLSLCCLSIPEYRVFLSKECLVQENSWLNKKSTVDNSGENEEKV